MPSHLLPGMSHQIAEAGELLDHPQDNRLFIEARLGTEPADELRAFRECHIHGAVFAQIREVFASAPTALSGSLPLPEPSALQERLRAWGVDNDTDLVVYGPSPALAARAWWVLRWAGLRRVRVLDGGLKAWIAAGGAVAQGDTVRPANPRSAALVLTPGQLPQISVQQVEQLDGRTVLLDARDEASFRAGAIPAAVNLPSSAQWTPASLLRTAPELRALYEAAGAFDGRDVVVYCGGGVLSALTVLTLSAFGAAPRLFVGSWSEWSRDAARMARSATAEVPA